MKLRRLAKSLGWALAYFVGDGLLFLGCVVVMLGWAGRAVPPAEVLMKIAAGVPFLFASVAMVHGITGKLARTNQALRKTALFVLWPLAFYLVTLASLILVTSFVPGTGGLFTSVILVPALAGGVAGSLCWRGKLPGTR